MSGFAGFEPQIGEIRAVRTFRVGPGGVLFPLFSKRPWTTGTNAAACNQSASHVPPEPDCTCGFYAYADDRAAAEYPFARYTLAVVACWGRVIAGTRGVRAQYARIEAIWLSNQVPGELSDMVRARYPSVAVYADRGEMLVEHPGTALDCYDTQRPESIGGSGHLARLVAIAALAAGIVPPSLIAAIPFGWAIWTSVIVVLLATVLAPSRGSDAARRRRRMLCMALILWMVAPLFGVAGLLFMRLPLLQIVALMLAQRTTMNRLARTFPAPI